MALQNEMSSPGVEPGLSRPRRDVLTTRRWGLADDGNIAKYSSLCEAAEFREACRELFKFETTKN